MRNAWTRSLSSACWSSSAGQLAKDVFDAIEDAALVVLRTRRRLELLLGQRLGELFEELLLLLIDLLRRDDLDRHEQIAAPASRDDVGHAAAAQPERGARLRPFGNLEALASLERRNRDLAAHRQRRVVERDLAEEIVAVAVKERMLLHVDDDVEIAGGAAAGA